MKCCLINQQMDKLRMSDPNGGGANPWAENIVAALLGQA